MSGSPTSGFARGFDELCRRTASVGLAVRGAFHPDPHELGVALPATAEGTLVLLGFTGSVQWHVFAQSDEAHDGLPHPLDRWSRRIIAPLARDFEAMDFYPNGTPRLPFQRLAARCEPVHRSPIGLLIHVKWGLWHAYRAALLLRERIEVPALMPSAHPCVACIAKPCLSSCPVGAFSSKGFDVAACAKHVQSAAGADCLELGCRARRACPVGAEFRYVGDQARFHMDAFLLSVQS
jgi:ferredoxin